jgi:hypothetical protein
MSTPSLILCKESGLTSKTLCALGVHWDGYPTGVGKDIFEAIGRKKLRNGVSDYESETEANGIECAIAALIKALKKGPGGVYIVNPATAYWQFQYVVYTRKNVIFLRIQNERGEVMADASLESLTPDRLAMIENDIETPFIRI